MIKTPLEELVARVQRLGAEVAGELLKQMVGQMEKGQSNLIGLEQAVRDGLRPLGAQLIEQALSTLGNGYRRAHRRCSCGGTLRYVNDREKTLASLFGPVKIKRAYYHCKSCGKGDAPLDGRLGMAKTSLTPAVQEAMAFADSALPFAKAQEFLRRTLGLPLSKAKHEDLADELGAAIAARERRSAGPPRQKAAEQLYISTDGVMVNTLEHWREARLGAAFSAHRDRSGNPVRGPTRYIGQLENAADFGQRLWELSERCGAPTARQVIVLGDGAPWIWKLAEFYFPEAVQIIDWFHALDHLWQVANRRWGEGDGRAKSWMEQREAALAEGRVEAIIRALRKIKARGDLAETVRKTIGYFAENRQRMRYGQFRAQGFFIGSGVVEAGCKHVVAQRFKQSGMRWSTAGFNHRLHLRLCIINGDWDKFAAARFPKISTYF